MIDREKVIKAWEIFRDSNPYEICSGREFRAIREPEYCMGQMIEDTILLLKAKEAVKPIKSWELNNLSMAIDIYLCGNCKEEIVGKGKYCSNCGTPVLRGRSVK